MIEGNKIEFKNVGIPHHKKLQQIKNYENGKSPASAITTLSLAWLIAGITTGCYEKIQSKWLKSQFSNRQHENLKRMNNVCKQMILKLVESSKRMDERKR